MTTEKRREYSREYYAKHKEACRERSRQYQVEHPEARRESKHRWASAHRDVCHLDRKSWQLKHPEKRSAHQALYRATVAEKIIRPSKCEICGGTAGAIEGHHFDYAKPLEVMWLCHDCHMSKIHGGSNG